MIGCVVNFLIRIDVKWNSRIPPTGGSTWFLRLKLKKFRSVDGLKIISISTDPHSLPEMCGERREERSVRLGNSEGFLAQDPCQN